MGTDYKTLYRLCADDLETINLLEQTRQLRKQGGDRRSKDFRDNNVSFEKPKKGNSTEYALQRLRRHRPDLHRQVIEGEMSVNQAMIQAGYRKKVVQLTGDLQKTATSLKLVFSLPQIKK